MRSSPAGPRSWTASAFQVVRCSAAGCVFGGSGVEGGLLGQVESFGLGGGSLVVVLERVDEVGGAGLDAGTARRPAGEQAASEPGDLIDGPPAVPADRGHGQAEVAETCGEAGGVRLGQVHLGCIERFGVQGAPVTGEGLDLGRDRGMGVQVGVLVGPFIRLMLCKWLVKRSHPMRQLDPNSAEPEEASLCAIVKSLADRAGLPETPEVWLYDSPDMNAFTTGPNKSSAMTAFSTLPAGKDG